MDSRALISAHPAAALIKKIDKANKRKTPFKERIKHLVEQMDMG
jgi:hypothetical protein